MNNDIKFDTNGDILYEIAMIIYDRHNSDIASINDHLGEIYSYQDLQNAERCELEDEKHLLELAVKQLQRENSKLKQWDKNKDTRNSRQRVEISRLLKENKELKSLLEKQSKINVADHKYASLKEDEVIKLTERLKQKDEVINKAIKMLEINIEIVKEQPSNDKLADKFIIERYNSLLEILRKYKGDNNEYKF